MLSGGSLLAAFGAGELALNGYRIAGFAAAFFTLIGFCCLSPYLTHHFGTWVGQIFRGLLFPRLAARNLVRSLYRHAMTIAALASALAMLISVSIMIYSFRKTVDRWLEPATGGRPLCLPECQRDCRVREFCIRRFNQLVAIAAGSRDDRIPIRNLTVTVNGAPVFLGVIIGTNRNIPDFIDGKNAEKYQALSAAGQSDNL